MEERGSTLQGEGLEVNILRELEKTGHLVSQGVTPAALFDLEGSIASHDEAVLEAQRPQSVALRPGRSCSLVEAATAQERSTSAPRVHRGPSTWSSCNLRSSVARERETGSVYLSHSLRLSYAREGVLQAVLETVKKVKASRQLGSTTLTRPMLSAHVAEWAISVAIVLNAITVGLSSDVAKGWQGLIVLDGCFAVVFGIEVFVKIGVYGVPEYFGLRRRAFAYDDLRWRLFEFALVVVSWAEFVLDTLGANAPGMKFMIFRLLRLTRIARVFRLFRLAVFAELLLMIRATIAGLMSLMWSVVLLALPLYAVAWVLREALGDKPGQAADPFRDVPTACFTMFRCIVGGDCNNARGHPIFVLVAAEYGWEFGCIYAITLLLIAVGLSNVIAAFFVEHALAIAKYSSACQRRERLLDVEHFAAKAVDMVELIMQIADAEGYHDLNNGRSSLNSSNLNEALGLQQSSEFFGVLLSYQEFRDVLEDLDVADDDKVNMFSTLDVDRSGSIDLEELVAGVARMRGDARRSDIIGVGLALREVHQKLSAMKRDLARHAGAQAQYLSVLVQLVRGEAPACLHRHGSLRVSQEDRRDEESFAV